jgi:hypothetical protein
MVRKLLAKQLAGTNTYPSVYGHFTYAIYSHYALPNKCDYRISIHTTDDYDILDFFTYGGPAFKKEKEVKLRMSICILADAADIDHAKQIELEYIPVGNLKVCKYRNYSVHPFSSRRIQAEQKQEAREEARKAV